MDIPVLKPCPFCAYETPKMSNRYQVVMEPDYFVVCGNCWARGPVAGYSEDRSAERRAAEKWNRVAPLIA